RAARAGPQPELPAPRPATAPRPGQCGQDRAGPGRALPVRDERGQIGGIEAVAFGVLVFVLGLLIVVNAWGVVDAKVAAAAAAHDAARAYVEAPSREAAE